jgi:hypothetical protein
MNLNKDIIDFKEPELRKKVDRIQYEREMTSIAIFLFIEKIVSKQESDKREE